MLTLIQSLLPEGSQKGSSLSCDESFLSKSQVRRRNKVLICPAFIFPPLMKICKPPPPKTTQHWCASMKPPPHPPGIGLQGKTPQFTPFVFSSPFDVQVTGGVNGAGFDVELGDFIVTSLPTRRAASYFSHLNNPVPLRPLFYKHQILKYMFSPLLLITTVLSVVGEGCAQI